MIAAVIPAAGLSTRMGRPKLLLKLGAETLIGQVVRSLRQGGVDRVVVTAPPAEAVEGPAIADEARSAGAEVLVPEARPAEMRDSIELALGVLAHGTPPDRVLLTPGDHPGVGPELVVKLLDFAARWPERIIIPSFEGRRGHPVVLPWSVAAEIRSLPTGLGVNALIASRRASIMELPAVDAMVVADLDTPDDLLRWNQESKSTEMMRVQVRLFALARNLAGSSEIGIEVPAGCTVAGLRVALAGSVPALRSLWPKVLIAVDEEYADDTTVITPESRIAVIPPVSGGTGFPSDGRGQCSRCGGLIRR